MRTIADHRITLSQNRAFRRSDTLLPVPSWMTVATWIAATALLLVRWSGLAVAAPVVVNVQLSHSSGVYSGQGALVTADAHIWNDYFLSPPTPIVDSTGASTTVTANVTQAFFYTPGSWTGNHLLDNSRGASSSPRSFTIGGLSTNGMYDLYLYGWNQQGFQANPTSFGGSFEITSGAGSNTNPQTTSGAQLVSGTDYTSSSVSTSALGKAYVAYTGLVPNGSGQITGTYSNVFNGFQLQGPFPIPEPATLSLLGVGAIGLLGRRRRRHAHCS